jgi:HAD superfamily hydrolase (TIGR01509 family)
LVPIKISGAIFDLDGTLLDSMPIWDNLGADFLRKRGITAPENLQEELRARSMEQAAGFLRDSFGLTDSVPDIVGEIHRMIRNLYVEVFPLKKGVPEFLALLRAKGVRMCIATATNEKMARVALERNKINHFFDGVFSCETLGIGKDSPDIFLHALRFLGTTQEETWVFEDALHALTTAKLAGFPVVAVYDASMHKQRDKLCGMADVFLTDYIEGLVIFSKT